MERIAKSYDRGIALGRKGIDSYANFPDYIIKDPSYPLFQKAKADGLDSDSDRREIKDYLQPASAMKFIDLGCCLNLMLHGYDQWPSLYYGIDISKETIALLEEVVAKKSLTIGSISCGGIHETPFDSNFFDIGACIGVLEYFDQPYIKKALAEAHRILKPESRFVLDIPDIENPMRQLMHRMEECLGRPHQFNLSPSAFDSLLQPSFTIEKTEKIGAVAMIQYFLKCKK